MMMLVGDGESLGRMDPEVLARSLRVARATERLGWLPPGSWPNVAVALLLEGAPDAEIAEVAGFGISVSGWTTSPLVEALYERHGVLEVDEAEAVEVVADLLAAELRSRPTDVTSPMVRLLARLAPPNYRSALANQAYGAEEYLDCDCTAGVDPAWEAELESRAGIAIPDEVTRALAAHLRACLPTHQPPHSH